MRYLIENINNYNLDDLMSFAKKIKKEKKDCLSKMNTKSYKQSVVGEILLARLLKEININYEDINIQYNENGKPFITNYNIYYNISHHEDLVICVVSTYMIGVDILKMNDVKKSVCKSFTSIDEYNYITSKYKFYEIYTLKEAYIKLFGKKINDIKTLNIVYDNHIRINVVYKTMKYNDYLISMCYLPK